MSTFLPLPKKRDFSHFVEYQARVFDFDPKCVYDRVGSLLDTTSRKPKIPFSTFFPLQKGVCACGCERSLPPHRTKWHSDFCMQFAHEVFLILKGDKQTISFYLEKYYGGRFCFKCNAMDRYYVGDDRRYKCDSANLELDHIIPVKFGGGGCWLGNYQFLCPVCHREKTNRDFGWKSRQPKSALVGEIGANGYVPDPRL